MDTANVCPVCHHLCHPDCRSELRPYLDTVQVIPTWQVGRREPAFPRIDLLQLTPEARRQRDALIDDIHDELIGHKSTYVQDAAGLDQWSDAQMQEWLDVSYEGLQRLRLFFAAGFRPNPNLLLCGPIV